MHSFVNKTAKGRLQERSVNHLVS